MTGPEKPRVFVSSTIADFADLRSAIKFWLEELGYEVRVSEFTDFDKPVDPNAFDACFESIRQAHYCVLLIGTRRGSLYSEAPEASVTQQEYRTAYELARGGRIHLIVMVRDSVWADYQKHPRPSGQELGGDLPFIFSFLDEVTRRTEVEDAVRRGTDYPPSNWVHPFRTFRDVVDILTVVLQAKAPLVRRALEANLEAELVLT